MKKVSVVIVNYNGRTWLPLCLESLARQTYDPVEIIFVDNCSTDDSVGFVRANFPAVHVYENTWNAGFAGGNNFGLQYATGEFILLLNTDTQVTPTFISDLLVAFEENPKLGCVQPKLIFMHDTTKLDSCGAYFSWTGFLKHIGNQQAENKPEWNKSFPVLSVKGACMMFRRDVLEKVGGLFDDAYWCYFEETDFCLRLWLAGYECWYYPKSVIYHAMGGTSGWLVNTSTQYYSTKNRLATYIKVFSAWTLVRMLPIHIAIHVALVVILSFIGQWKNAWAIIRAFGVTIRHLPDVLRKRAIVQKHIRKISDAAFLQQLTRSMHIRGMFLQLWYFITFEKHKHKPIDTSVL